MSDTRQDTGRWNVHTLIEKWDPDQAKFAKGKLGVLNPTSDQMRALLAPAEITEDYGNLLTTAGVARIHSLILGAGGQAATNTATRIGVGNSTTAAAVGQTDLSASAGSTNRYFMTMDVSYPQIVTAQMAFRATFASADGNFAWEEWCIDVGAPTVAAGNTVGALMLNRKVQANGTKVLGAIWTPTMTITIA